MFPMDTSDHATRLRNILLRAPHVMAALRAVRTLALPDWAIGAGFIRSAVWDHLSGLPVSPVDDIDVLYFDPADLTWAPEEHAETALSRLAPGLPWSVRNQARMHLRKNDAPYRSTEDAMHYWLETPTCAAVRLEADDALTVMAPFGLADLFARCIRPTPRGRLYVAEYRERLERKAWQRRWPGITVEWP